MRAAVPAADAVPDTADELFDRWSGNEPLIEVDRRPSGARGPARRHRRHGPGQATAADVVPRATAQPGDRRPVRQVPARRPLAVGSARAVARRSSPAPSPASSAPASMSSASTTSSTCGSATANTTSTTCSSGPGATGRACCSSTSSIRSASAAPTSERGVRHCATSSTCSSSELDGADADNDGVFVLGATNHPWDVDSGADAAWSIRPDRVGPTTRPRGPRDDPSSAPSWPARRAVRPAARRPGDRRLLRSRSGARLRAGHRTGDDRLDPQRNGAPDLPGRLVDAVRTVQPSIGPWVETARNFATYGNDSGMYDDLVDYLKRGSRNRWRRGGR